jgi:uncharacterized membrane protein
MDLTALLDRALPGPGSLLDRASQKSQGALSSAVHRPGVAPVTTALRGDEWLGHPLHPVVVALPIGAWAVGAWYDARSALTHDPRSEEAADEALRFGVVAALAAATTGLVQYVDARDQARRETVVHAVLNNVALGLYVTSLAMRKRGRRPLGRRLAAAGLGLVSISGWLGGDLAYRHGVGVGGSSARGRGHSRG